MLKKVIQRMYFLKYKNRIEKAWLQQTFLLTETPTFLQKKKKRI